MKPISSLTYSKLCFINGIMYPMFSRAYVSYSCILKCFDVCSPREKIYVVLCEGKLFFFLFRLNYKPSTSRTHTTPGMIKKIDKVVRLQNMNGKHFACGKKERKAFYSHSYTYTHAFKFIEIYTAVRKFYRNQIHPVPLAIFIDIMSKS